MSGGRSSRRSGARRGITLVELLIVLAITALLASALGYAFSAELTMQRVEEARRAEQDRSDATERRITRLLQGAKLAEAGEPVREPVAEPAAAPGVSAAPGRLTRFVGASRDGAGDLGCDRLTWTTTAPAVPMAALYGTEDFESQQQARGPAGGLAEVSLSATPVGDPGGRTGLFERVQRPGDADPTQGGTESVLDPEVARIGFQFWDGGQWLTAWDSADGPARLPQAVRVSYTVRGRPAEVRVFDVPLPASDVSASSPLGAGQ